MEQQIHLISVRSVNGTCFVVPDLKYNINCRDEEDKLDEEILYHQCGMSDHNVISMKDRSLFVNSFME